MEDGRVMKDSLLHHEEKKETNKKEESDEDKGFGFQATYQLGVAQSMLDLAPLVLQAAPKVMGASAGSLVAAALVCGSSLDMVRDEMLRFALQSRGPLHLARNVFVWIEGLLRRSLPDDAHIRASGRLAVAMTRIPDGQNTVVSEFTSREDVVQALLCSCFIPGYHGIQPPSYKGVYYVDGGMSSIQPTHSSPYAHTLTVSPFAGEADICPPDPGSMYVIVMSGMPLNCSVANGYRILEALYPYNWEVGPQNNPYSLHPALYPSTQPSTHSPSSPPSLLPLHPALYLSD
ncbi:patatin-like phospholipase domain-containing protein 2 [Oncorhynchus kisutch]|uniref:patatin-like phospholipase domain-containing protein 2 n=1 Tax=Oncorhynchus kisutch TaxID=8019 RepID=UPI0012DCF6A7|nr:patatin-like phospholipase domain-containing protein 2 [Oncorhynchus kisutch]